MYKKIITACMAVAALAAFALPASASAASPALTEGSATGPLAPVGTALTATAGVTKFTASGGITVECETAHLSGVLTKNSGNGEAIEGTIESASFHGGGETTPGDTVADCTGSLGNVKVTTNVGNGTPWCVKATPGAGMVLDVYGNACGSKVRGITFVLDAVIFGLPVECKYERSSATGPVTGTYNTAPEDAKGTFTGGAGTEFKLESGFGCPESGTLDMTLTLEKSNGTQLFIS